MYDSPGFWLQPEVRRLRDTILEQAGVPLVPMNGNGTLPSLPNAPVVTRSVPAPGFTT